MGGGDAGGGDVCHGIARFEDGMKNEYAGKIAGLFEKTGEKYKKKLGIKETEIQELNNVHAYYVLENEKYAIHIEGLPYSSSEQKTRVLARLMDYEKIKEIRNKDPSSVGNEYQAEIRIFDVFKAKVGNGGTAGILMKYSPRILYKKLKKELKTAKIKKSF